MWFILMMIGHNYSNYNRRNKESKTSYVIFAALLMTELINLFVLLVIIK